MARSLDPRAKLYLLLLANLMLFFHVGTAAEAVMVLLFLLPFLPARRARTGARLACAYLVMLLVDVFVIPIASGFWLNLLSMLSVGIRMIWPCIVTGAYAFGTTTMGEWVCALRRLRTPESVIIPCVVVARFFPTLKEDYGQIRDAMALRGIAEGAGALIRHPAQSLEYILIPLLMNGSNVAQDLSVAALTKGIGLPGKHTSMTELRMSPADWCYMALCTAPLALAVGGVL